MPLDVHDVTPGVNVWPLITAANAAGVGLSLRIAPTVTYDQAFDKAEDLAGNLAGPLTLDIQGTAREAIYGAFRSRYKARPNSLIFASLAPVVIAPVVDPVADQDKVAILETVAAMGKDLDRLAGKG